MSETASYNRTYKDSVFVDLFSTDEKAKERFLSLYNALHGTKLPLHCPIEQLKLDNTMYRGLINDVSCLVDNKIIVLAEHQSTINENMPLRCLEYIARLYEHILPPEARYYRTLQKIPVPEFYIFYNGLEDYPETTILKLSDAFMTKPDTLPLELAVKVFNINTNKENLLLKRCKPLDEYSLFVQEVRIQTHRDPENGFTNAVKICIEKDILKEYLQRKSREVINMLIAEYDYDTDIAMQRKESLMLGIQQGITQGIQQGITQGIQQGITQGIQQGFSEGVRKTASVLKQMGLEMSQIAQATGLSVEELEQI